MAQIISFSLKRRLLQVRADCSGGHQSAAIVIRGCVIALLFFNLFVFPRRQRAGGWL